MLTFYVYYLLDFKYLEKREFFFAHLCIISILGDLISQA